MITRTKVAQNISIELDANRKKAVEHAAAWLVANKKTRQAKYLANDIALQLQKKGYVFAKITVASGLSKTAHANLKKYISKITDAKEVELEIIVNETLIGGAKIETPGGTFDDSVQYRLKSFLKEVETNE